MKDITYEELLEQTTVLYQAEKEIAEILPNLKFYSNQPTLQEELGREVEENKKQCARLEGLLTILTQASRSGSQLNSHENFYSQFALTLKRVILNHQTFGYATAISTALALGKNEMVAVLKQHQCVAEKA